MTGLKANSLLLLALCAIATNTVLLIAFVISTLPGSTYLQRSPSYQFYAATSDTIQYNGRWVNAPNRRSRYASFPGYRSAYPALLLPSDYLTGSSLDFLVYNSSCLYLDLANLRSIPVQTSDQNGGKVAAHTLPLTPKSAELGPVGPVSLLVTINVTAHQISLENTWGLRKIVEWLDPNEVHDVRVTLLRSLQPSTLHLRGVRLDQGGALLHVSGYPSAEPTDQTLATSNSNRWTLEPVRPSHRRQLIEIMSTPSFLGPEFDLVSASSRDIRLKRSWSDLIAHTFINTTVSTTPLAEDTCLTSQCQQQTPSTPSAQSLFFRSGPPGTALHNHLWPRDMSTGVPSALVLLLGLADMKYHLKSQKEDHIAQHTRQFINEFAHTYSNFIQTLRRTSYAASALTQFQDGVARPDIGVDESYLYNSSPSNLPIFLVVPPLPSGLDPSKYRIVQTMLSHALRQVVDELKWHIGDTYTYIIDAVGWLSEDDFEYGESDVGFTLKQSGHVKFAYHMAGYLCHYLADRQVPQSFECAFDRSGDYVGNLYVPETAVIGKIMEEKKVARMKQIFGVQAR